MKHLQCQNIDNKIHGLWITWERQLRNHGLSKAFGYNLVEIDFDSKVPRSKRYLLSVYKTIITIRNEHPDVVVVQNPSIILSLLAVFLRPFFKYFLVIDAHNSGIFPFDNKNKVLNFVAGYLQRKANITIVTNQSLADHVNKNHGHSCVLPDSLPDLPKKLTKIALDGKINIVFICTYHDDEPYEEVIDAAMDLSDDIVIYITGNHKNRFDNDKLPKNIRLTGYLPLEQYWSLLYSANVLMDLTTRENCLVCGAYESVALEKPMVLSNTLATRNYFSKGCVYADPTKNSISSAIKLVTSNLLNYQSDISSLKIELVEKWKSYLTSCIKQIQTGYEKTINSQ